MQRRSAVANLSPISQRPHSELVAGRYELVELLGEGGMGAIWRARHVALQAPVAIKFLRSDQASGELAERLLREARAVAKLGHPAIVRVTDFGETSAGAPFLVMELLHGQSLARLLEREGPISAERAVQMLLPIADALMVAHRKSIVHRDLKPDNVFLALQCHGVQPKLLDFGIVKLEPNRRRRRLTQTGMVVGSPNYMSPEQAWGDENLDYRSDIWSFCVMLYEVITGRLPFYASSYEAQLRAIVEQPLERVGIEDDKLWAILERGLAKDKDQRFPSMSKLGQELASWLLERGVPQDICGDHLETRWLVPSLRPPLPSFDVVPQPEPRLRRIEQVLPPVIAAIGLAALAAIGAAAWFESEPDHHAAPTKPQVPVKPAEPGEPPTVVAY
ncbi:MAG TPA: serine/threonine-protein kinase [Polyangiaceae bacterium]|nr:serine/threonine-protein kinase [Polyangiaceae bacterium]